MSLDIADCPRCQAPLDAGFINAGKGPFRWNEGDPDATIVGGELLLDRPLLWGRQRTPAVRCLKCFLVLFEFDADAETRAVTPSR
jgi:hypothetical protein